jgi:protein-S-isoprenylcysteine O-methyltransferase Ste14
LYFTYFSLGRILFLVACEFLTPSFVVLLFVIAFIFLISESYLGDYTMSVL